MFEIGRVCVKIAGRDAGKIGVVVDTIDEKHVLIDGDVRRRKCNINHLEVTDKTVKVSKQASHNDVRAALEKIQMTIAEKKETQRKEQRERPTKQRKKKVDDKKEAKATPQKQESNKEVAEKKPQQTEKKEK